MSEPVPPNAVYDAMSMEGAMAAIRDLQARIEREQVYSRKLTSFIERNVSGGIHGNGLALSAPIGRSRPKEGWEQLDDAMLAHLRSLPPAPLAKCPDCGCQLEGGTNCGCSHPCHLAADGTGSGEPEGP